MKQGHYFWPLAFLLKGGKTKCPERQKEREIKNLNLLLESIIDVRGAGERTATSESLDSVGFVSENWL